MLNETVGNGLCAVPPSPRYLRGTLNGIPSVQTVSHSTGKLPVGLWLLRGRNGTQAVPYEMNEPYPIHPACKKQFGE